MALKNLLTGELKLTLDIILSLAIGEIILRFDIAGYFLKHIKGINKITALALAVSIGSSKTGAGILAKSLDKKIISEKIVIWSVLMLPLISYLKRWPMTFMLAIGLAGFPGGLFALFLIGRSLARFFLALCFLKKYDEPENFNNIITAKTTRINLKSFVKKLARYLPVSWLFFAIAYSIVPYVNKFLEAMLENNFMLIPLSGWAVAAASVAHVNSALALTGGAIASGSLNNSQALFSLILGSALGLVTRILRQDAGYYFGLFKFNLALKILLLNFMTVLPFVILSLIFSGIALLF